MELIIASYLFAYLYAMTRSSCICLFITLLWGCLKYALIHKEIPGKWKLRAHCLHNNIIIFVATVEHSFIYLLQFARVKCICISIVLYIFF